MGGGSSRNRQKEDQGNKDPQKQPNNNEATDDDTEPDDQGLDQEGLNDRKYSGYDTKSTASKRSSINDRERPKITPALQLYSNGQSSTHTEHTPETDAPDKTTFSKRSVNSNSSRDQRGFTTASGKGEDLDTGAHIKSLQTSRQSLSISDQDRDAFKDDSDAGGAQLSESNQGPSSDQLKKNDPQRDNGSVISPGHHHSTPETEDTQDPTSDPNKREKSKKIHLAAVGKDSDLMNMNDQDPSETTQEGKYCKHCPHCADKFPTPQWVVKDAPKCERTIDMDEYNKDVTKQKSSHLHDKYSFEEDDNRYGYEKPTQYIKLPMIIRTGLAFSPANTPYPNYDQLQSHVYDPSISFEFDN